MSFDVVNVQWPNRKDAPPNKRWAHQDQDPERPGFRCLQGLVNLNENGPDDGGLVVMRGGHKISEEYHNAFKDEERIWQWTNEWYGFKDTGLEWLKERGYEVRFFSSPTDNLGRSDGGKTVREAGLGARRFGDVGLPSTPLQRRSQRQQRPNGRLHMLRPGLHRHARGLAKEEGSVRRRYRIQPLAAVLAERQVDSDATGRYPLSGQP